MGNPRVRTCTTKVDCDFVVKKRSLVGGGGDRGAKNVDKIGSENRIRDSQTASKLSHPSDTSFPAERRDKLCRISAENKTEARTPGEQGLQQESSKAVGTFQAESTSDSLAGDGRNIHSGKRGHAEPCKPNQKDNLYHAKTAESSGNQAQPAVKSRDKLPSASGQVLMVKEKSEPSKYSSKSSSMIWQVKEKKDSKDPSIQTSSSNQVHSGQPGQKREKYSAEAVKKSTNRTQAVKNNASQAQPAKKCGNQLPPAHKQVSKGKIQAIEKSGNQLHTAPNQVWRVKENTDPSQDSRNKSSKVWQDKKKPSTLSSKTSSSRSKPPRPRQRRRRNRVQRHIKCDDSIEIGYGCNLCENDLTHCPVPIDEEFSDKLPDVAILPCGHAFHILCMEEAIPEDQLKDPPCFICVSSC